MDAQKILNDLLSKADIKFNGSRPWDVRVHDDRLYNLILTKGTLGIGESYMQGWWDCDQLDVLFEKAISADLENMFSNKKMPAYILKALQTVINLQSRSRAFEVGEKHYDFGNDMFSWMLGPSMNYSCGYWRNAKNLDEAEQSKMDLICRKLCLEQGMSVLDIGCGWGMLGNYMKQHYGVEVTGISVSREQIHYAREHFPECNWLLEDYRDLEGKFNRIVSVGMFEHVGYKNYKSFMKKVSQLLDPDGLFLLHTIGANKQRKGTDPWIHKYIFPNGMLPSQVNLVKAFCDYFIMEDWHNFGADYDKTLMAWLSRFEDGCEKNMFAHNEEMRRMFRYYLASCAGAFRARDIQLWQLVLSIHGVAGGYCSVR